MLVSLFFISCEKDNSEINEIEGSNLLSTQSTITDAFDAESAYFTLLESTDMITDFQENYSAAEKSLIWDYKYKRLLAESDGSFTDNQIQLINEIKTLVSEEDFFATPESYEVEELEDISLEVFSAEESAFLFYSLENKDGDITVNPTTGEPVTDCFWCYQEIPGGTSGPCEAIVDSDGDILGFTRDNVQVDKVRFFIFRTETTINGVPCGFNDWVAGGMQIRD